MEQQLSCYKVVSKLKLLVKLVEGGFADNESDKIKLHGNFDTQLSFNKGWKTFTK